MLYSNHINIAASFIAILILIYIAVMTFTKKPIPIVPKATSLMLVIWILSGIILYRLYPTNIDNFVSNLINSAVAIGTIGTVITSLYLANKKPDRASYIDLYDIALCRDDISYKDTQFINLKNLLTKKTRVNTELYIQTNVYDYIFKKSIKPTIKPWQYPTRSYIITLQDSKTLTINNW